MADDTISTLNSLIETSKDGENGYRTAAGDVLDAQLKAVFLAASENCAVAARELQALVRERGGIPEEGGSITAALHRGWLDMRSAISGRDDGSILEEVERGEDAAKKSYAHALKKNLPDDVRLVVQRQYEGVLRNHQRAKELRDSYTAKRP